MPSNMAGAGFRVEDWRLIRGEGRYTDDIEVEGGMLHAAFARSAVAHGLLRSIDLSPLEGLEIAGAFTLDDYLADGCLPVPYLLPSPENSCGVTAFFPPRWPLADGRLRFVGDPFALIVAPSRIEAQNGAESVIADVEPLPALVSMTEAAGHSSPIWPERPDNLCFLHEAGDADAVEAAFAKADHIVKGTFVIPRIAINPLEPRGCVIEYDTTSDRIVVHAGFQDVFGAKKRLCAALNLDPSRVDVVAPNVGGSFGMKQLDVETLAICWAALKLRRSIKWVASRSESFVSDNQGRDNVTEAQLAVAADGTFLGLKVSTLANIGAYAGQAASASPVNNLGSLAGVYRTPAIHVSVRGIFTNSNPTGPYRGAGRPEASYVIERLVDLAALRAGIDRIEIRRRNMIRPEQMPFVTALTYTYDCGEFEQVMDNALAAGDWNSFPHRRQRSERQGLLRGIGVACVIERASIINAKESARLEARADGSLRIVIGGSDQGQGHATFLTRLARDELGVPEAPVEVAEADTRALAAGGSTGGSRTTTMASTALVGAVADLVQKARNIAGRELEADMADIVFDKGVFRIAGTDRALSLQEVAQQALPEPLTGESTFVAPSVNFPNGCHVCEVEIDPETGGLRLCSYVVVDDVGNILNHKIVEGQLHGGIAQGIGEALMEAVRLDEATGQLLSGSLMDYPLPRASDLCSIATHTHPVPTATNPLGVKGVGEAGTVGALPAVVSAVADALREFGIEHVDMPLTSATIWSAIQQAKGSASGESNSE